MIKWFPSLRVMVYMRRAARALESIAASQRTIALVAEDSHNRRHSLGPYARTKSRGFESGALDVDAVNKSWRDRCEELGVDPRDDSPNQ